MNAPDPTTRLNAALEGRYHIERELGQGGMATVYLAADIKHARNVALKVLKPELAAVVGAERFLAEIKTTANLQHPHILPLFDSGQADSFLFYVMPFVEGETLRDRLDREHQLPVADAVQIAKDVGEALAYAHGHGVIHRDIKPANILIHSGRPVLSDFGIALAVGAAGGGRLTETGLSLGTPHYMSPEQATGDLSVGAATDIYALGCVLYEMLVGEPPYTGSTAQAILGKIITETPAQVTKQRKMVPLNVEAAISKALEKVPADRFAGAADFARALSDPGFRHGEGAGVSVGPAHSRWNALTTGFAVATLAFGGLAGWALLRPDPPLPMQRFASPFLPGQEPLSQGTAPFDISDDGSTLVYVGEGDQLWVRRWENLEGSPIPGTAAAASVSVSPDGGAIAFTTRATRQTYTLSLSGGSARTLMSAGFPHWGRDGFVYATNGEGTIRVRADGGTPEMVAKRDPGEGLQVVTDVLPGGRRALVQIGRTSRRPEIHGVDLNTGDMKLIRVGSGARYAPTGHLLFVDPETREVMAVRFDPETMETTGDPISMLEGASWARLAESGTLVYSGGTATMLREFIWVTRTGVVDPLGWSFASGQGREWSLSPDDARVAFTSDGTEPGSQNIWIKELPDGPMSIVADEEGHAWQPRWREDGETITYTLGVTGSRSVISRRADGTGQPQLLLDGSLDAPGAQLSPGEDWLVLRVGFSAGASMAIMAMRPDVDSVPLLLLGGDYNASQPTLSPDGRWLAYTSDESGQSEVYVRPFPEVDGARRQVSSDGGLQPMWAHNGRELFYVSASREMWAAQFETSTGFRVVGRELLFEVPSEMIAVTNSRWTSFTTSSDDRRFLMTRRYENQDEGGYSGFVLIQNWTAELKRLLPN